MAQIIEIANYALLLVYGSVIAFNFAGYEKTAKNRKAIALLVLLILSLQLAFYFSVGLLTTARLYPLITHLPSVLFIEWYLKKPRSIAIVSVLTAYLCCQPPNWLGLAMNYFWDSPFAFPISDSIGIVIMFFLLRRFVASPVNQVMSYSKRSLYLFGSFPLCYYLFDYSTTIYTGYLYTGAKIVVEFFPSVLSMFYIVFIIVYSVEMQRRNKLELDNAMLAAQSERAKNEIFSLQQVQKQTAIYRHDMRHHLSLLYGFLESGETDAAMEYIRQTQADIDGIVPVRYCENNTVNLILSAFAAKAEQKGVDLSIDAALPDTLPFPDTELCTLLSNGLENAIAAAEKEPESMPRSVRLNCRSHKGNLLILIENSFSGNVEMKNGIPQAREEGHGYGTKSITMLAEKYNGYYSFTTKDGLFILKVVLPMGV